MRISEEEYLEHYGVKGMKWGVINARDYKKKAKSGTSKPFLNSNSTGSGWRPRSKSSGERRGLKSAEEWFKNHPGDNIYLWVAENDKGTGNDAFIIHRDSRFKEGTAQNIQSYSMSDIRSKIIGGKWDALPKDVRDTIKRQFPNFYKMHLGYDRAERFLRNPFRDDLK